jgi:hypothetical protein
MDSCQRQCIPMVGSSLIAHDVGLTINALSVIECNV